MTKDLILAIDQGTTGTKVQVVNGSLKILSTHSVEFRQHYPKPGWVEHDVEDIWKATMAALKGALSRAKAKPTRIAAIGITNQRETVCFWSRKTGKTLCRAIVWQDRRTSDFCNELKSRGLEGEVARRTGLVIDPYFSATKIRWALDNIPAVKNASTKGDLAVGTIDSYVIARLTGFKSHVTEPSNASRTMVFNIEKLEWDFDLLRELGISPDLLPEVKQSADEFGVTKGVKILPDGIPIRGVLGDQQAALLGQACIEPGQAKCTYGTGSFILMNTGPNLKRSSTRMLTTVAWKLKGTTHYALEGAAFTAGAAVQWVRDGLGLIKHSADIEKLARKTSTSDGVIFVPALTGLGSPYWAPDARASFLGITRGTKPEHMARAVLEGIAFINRDILKAMERDLGTPLRGLSVDGGAAANNLLMQLQADYLGAKLVRPKILHTTALGAVFAAGIQAGIWTSLSDVRKTWKKDREFTPQMPTVVRDAHLLSWERAVHAISTLKL